MVVIDDTRDSLGLVLDLKRRPPTDELIGQDPSSPRVDSASEGLDPLGLEGSVVHLWRLLQLSGRVKEDLGSHVVEGPAAREGDLLVPVHRKAKVAEPHRPTLREEDVLGLNVTVHEMKRVHLLQDT